MILFVFFSVVNFMDGCMLLKSLNVWSMLVVFCLYIVTYKHVVNIPIICHYFMFFQDWIYMFMFHK
jgi:hypothetical protein